LKERSVNLNIRHKKREGITPLFLKTNQINYQNRLKQNQYKIMKKITNVSIALEIVDNLTANNVFKDEESENKATHIVLSVLKTYPEIGDKIKPKRNLKDKTLAAVDIAHKMVDSAFIKLKETLNQEDDV
tara:strand:+ start:423 stop:812 length:390 start_codon:yes stop_codon:yes gene_type:complete